MSPVDLQRFCAVKGDLRTYLHQPFIQDGFVHATTGNIIVRVPVWQGAEAEYQALDEKHKVQTSRIFAAVADRADWIALPVLSNAPPCTACKGRKTIRGSMCDDCDGDGDGDGEFEHGHHMYDCKNCEGTGVDLDGDTTDYSCWKCGGKGWELTGIKIGQQLVDLGLLNLIKDLPGVELSLGAADDHIGFRFEGGDGVLMPMRR